MNAPSSQGTVLRYFGTRTDDVIFESAAVIIGRSVIIILIMLKRLRQDALSPALEGRLVLRHEVDGDHEGSRSGSKRLAVGVGILIAASTCVVAVDPLPIPHFRRPNAHRDRPGALEFVHSWDDWMFQRQTRMERVDFYPLLRAIEPLIAKNEEMARRRSGSGISPEVTST